MSKPKKTDAIQDSSPQEGNVDGAGENLLSQIIEVEKKIRDLSGRVKLLTKKSAESRTDVLGFLDEDSGAAQFDAMLSELRKTG